MSAVSNKQTPLRAAVALTLAVALFELGGGIVSGSLALVADAAHVFMDAFALGIALAASIGAARPATSRLTFGYGRLEILAALGNGGLLFAIAVLIVVEAVHRFNSAALPQGGLMALFATVGLAVNVVIAAGLARSAHDDLNVKAALFHVASDVVGAFAVAVGGLLVLWTRAAWIDPVLSLFVAAIIIVGVVRIVREASDVLLESAPAHVALPLVNARIRTLPGVVDVHDLHVWTLGSGSHALAAHVSLEDAKISEASALLRRIEAALREEFAITHVTLQFECETCAPDERVICTQTTA